MCGGFVPKHRFLCRQLPAVLNNAGWVNAMRSGLSNKIFSVLIGAACLLTAAAEPKGSVPPHMALIPGGELTPLFRGERDPKKIKIEPFCLDVLPVTNSDFLEFVRTNPKWRKSAIKRIFADQDYLK